MVDVDHMIGLLRKLDYAYTYRQSIGFFLHRAVRRERDCIRFKDFGLKFDFYLEYGLKHSECDRNLRLHFPSFLAWT